MKIQSVDAAIERWEKTILKLKKKRKKASSLRYEAIYTGKIMQKAEDLAQLKALREELMREAFEEMRPKPGEWDTPAAR